MMTQLSGAPSAAGRRSSREDRLERDHSRTNCWLFGKQFPGIYAFLLRSSNASPPPDDGAARREARAFAGLRGHKTRSAATSLTFGRRVREDARSDRREGENRE